MKSTAGERGRQCPGTPYRYATLAAEGLNLTFCSSDISTNHTFMKLIASLPAGFCDKLSFEQ